MRLQSPNTDGKVGYCLDVTDLFLAKCAANREKDREFNLALLVHGIVDITLALSRVESMPIDDDAKRRIVHRIARLSAEAEPAMHPTRPSSPKP